MRRLLALGLGCLAAGLLLAGFELRLRQDEARLSYLWDSDRRFTTRPGTGDTNPLGFHERELPFAPPPGERRVVVLGDSIAWGTGPAAEAFPRMAEDRLGAPWRVVSLAHYGYDARQARAVLREIGWKYEPSLVVYATYTNDPIPSRAIEVGGGRVWVADEGLFPSPVRRMSALARRLEGAVLARGLGEEPEWEFYDANLAAMAADAASHGVPLAVLGLVPHVLADPDPAACSTRLGVPGRCEAHEAIARRQAESVRSLGLPYRPTLPALRASGETSFYPDDRSDWQHPGPAGHRLLAAELITLVREVTGG